MERARAVTPQCCLMVVICMFLTITSLAQTSPSNKKAVARTDEYMKALVRLDRFSGTVLVAREGQVLLSKGYGFANLEQDVPNTPQTKFRLGSVSKQFNAMAIMLLQQQGKLSVQDSVCNYVPACPNAWKLVTIHHLLTHTSGIPSYTEFPDNDDFERKPMTVTATIERFKNKPLEFKPGERFHYDNSGYALLGYIVELVSGKSYEEFLRENIFAPLGMLNSGYDHPRTILKHRAAGYARRRDALVNATYMEMDTPFSSGALYSTVEDIYLWDQALDTEKLLKRQALAVMFTPMTDEEFGWHGYTRYGYGWHIMRQFNRRLVYHTGHISGFVAYIGRYPEDKVSIIILSNREDASVRRASRDLGAIVIGQKYNLPRTSPKVAAQILDAYVGQYQLPDGFPFSITKDADKLMLVLGQGKFELFPQSETEFELFLPEADDQLMFVKDKTGHVTHLLINWETQVKKIK